MLRIFKAFDGCGSFSRVWWNCAGSLKGLAKIGGKANRGWCTDKPEGRLKMDTWRGSRGTTGIVS